MHGLRGGQMSYICSRRLTHVIADQASLQRVPLPSHASNSTTPRFSQCRNFSGYCRDAAIGHFQSIIYKHKLSSLLSAYPVFTRTVCFPRNSPSNKSRDSFTVSFSCWRWPRPLLTAELRLQPPVQHREYRQRLLCPMPFRSMLFASVFAFHLAAN